MCTPLYKINLNENGDVSLSWEMPRDRHYDDSDFPQIQIPKEKSSELTGKVIQISGRLPMWLFGYGTVLAKRAGAAEIHIFNQQDATGYQVFPLPENASAEDVQGIKIFQKGSETVVSFESKNFQFEKLASYLAKIPPCQDGNGTLCLTGRGSANWMVCAFALKAQEEGYKKIFFRQPTTKYSTQFFPELESCDYVPFTERDNAHTKGVVVGVVGDPNSGKSVFCHMLEKALLDYKRELFPDVWRLDCDFAAPTPEWYLYQCELGNGDKVEEVRKKVKRKWTHTAEEQIRDKLANIKRSLYLVIADLPGGIHKEGEVPRRIPAGRTTLFENVDAFVILNRPDKNSGEAWKQDLAKVGFADRILCVVDSVEPNAPFSFRVNPVSAVSGLSRTTHANDQALKALADFFCERISLRNKRD